MVETVDHRITGKFQLTQAGKIAIVYTHEKDREEYMRHLSYLIEEGYIKDQIEDLILSTLQGVQGLRALRVAVSDQVSKE